MCVCVPIDFLDRKKSKGGERSKKEKNFRAKIVIKERNKWRGRKFSISWYIYNGIVSVNFLQCNVASGKIIRRIALSILSRNSLRVTTYNTIARINFIGEITLERKRKGGKNWN